VGVPTQRAVVVNFIHCRLSSALVWYGLRLEMHVGGLCPAYTALCNAHKWLVSRAERDMLNQQLNQTIHDTARNKPRTPVVSNVGLQMWAWAWAWARVWVWVCSRWSGIWYDTCMPRIYALSVQNNKKDCKDEKKKITPRRALSMKINATPKSIEAV
jgi:hypothetical protein